ncbi:S26 family signal peptidase [Geoalkalibacter halelectricus]|uniref:S26 family signal peptidase n=1 Tax=Geoalkalibacter halelectricus TaxID=2847045 RepID=UPI003D23D621
MSAPGKAGFLRRLLRPLRHRSPRFLACTLFLGLGVFLAAAQLPRHFALTLTDSVTPRLFFLDEAHKAGPGDYVLFRIAEERIRAAAVGGILEQVRNGGEVRVIKRIGCVEGQRLVVVEREYFCEGVWLGRAKEVSRKGEPLTAFVFNGKIPAGEVFVVGDHPDSFDSRYFGLVGRAAFLARARPLF